MMFNMTNRNERYPHQELATAINAERERDFSRPSEFVIVASCN
jgi:hypothetical protein